MPGRFELSNIDLEEVSQVESGDNPPAVIVFMKNDPTGEDLYVKEPLFRHASKMRRRKKKGKRPEAPWC